MQIAAHRRCAAIEVRTDAPQVYRDGIAKADGSPDLFKFLIDLKRQYKNLMLLSNPHLVLCRRGAAAMKSYAAKDRRFYTDLTHLQRLWKVQISPPSGHHMFQVDTAPGPLVATAFPNARALAAGTNAVVPILSDKDGFLRVQVEQPSTSQPSVMSAVEKPKPLVYRGASQVRCSLHPKQTCTLPSCQVKSVVTQVKHFILVSSMGRFAAN